MQQEMFAIFAFERVDDLLILSGAERRRDKRLGFTPGEQGRSVGARQNADLRLDRANSFQITAIDT